LKLADIPSGTTVFIDANVPLAGILRDWRAPEVEAFLRRIAAGEIQAVTSVVVISEIFHRALIAEVCEALGLKHGEALRRVKQDPSVFESVHKCYEAVDDFMSLCSQVWPLDQDSLRHALRLSKMHHLLISDATHVALMDTQQVFAVASFDRDLARVRSIQVYGSNQDQEKEKREP
jgi:predicted nucleic acid-binding protein